MTDYEVEAKFIEYFASGSLNDMAELMTDDGEFDIQVRNRKIITGSKHMFLKWLEKQWKDFKFFPPLEYPLKIDAEICSGCNKGCSVFMFEDGFFPYKPEKESYTRYRKALALNVVDGRVKNITTCGEFENRDNPWLFEALIYRADEIKKEKNCNYMTAYIEARVELFGKHKITIDNEFIFVCEANDKKDSKEHLNTDKT